MILKSETRCVVSVASNMLVMTLDGLLPAAHLRIGQAVLTRMGVVPLIGVSLQYSSLDCVGISPGVFGRSSPGTTTYLPADQMIYLRNWRAQMFGLGREAPLLLHMLVNDETIFDAGTRRLSLVTLQLETPQVIYAGGLELCCGFEEQNLHAA
ncbi:MAG: Hint domain-containing protein [Pseudomonadota bacterium]